MIKHIRYCASRFILYSLLLLLPCFSLPQKVLAYGGSDGGGGGGGSDGGWGGADLSSGSVDVDIWNIPTGFDEPETAGDTVKLETPQEQELKRVWEGLGGRSGTGQSYEDWQKSERAGKVMIQQRLEREAAQAQTGSSRINIAVITLEYVDSAGRVAQVGLSFIPAVGAGTSAGLDAGREFADVYQKARDSGASHAEAISQGMKSATVKGATSMATAGLIGKVAGDTWDKAAKITGGRVKDVAKKGSGYMVSMGLKVVEFGTNAGIDEIRSNVDIKMPNNQAPQPQQQTAIYQTHHAR